MKRLMVGLLAAALLAALCATPAQADFGLHDLDVTYTEADGSTAILSGSHPFAMTTNLAVDTVEDPVLKFPVPEEDFRDLTIDTPEGLVADRDAVPQCTTAEFRPPGGGEPECAIATTVGVADVEITGPGKFFASPVYNLTPPSGAVAKLGFQVLGAPVTIELGLSTDAPYHGVARLSNALQVFAVYSSKVTLWGVPAAEAHDADRGGSIDIAERPFLTLPRSCTGPLPTVFRAISWQGGSFEETLLSHGDAGEPLGMQDCQALGFAPSIAAQPTNHSAESPTGLDFNLDIANPGLTNAAGRSDSDIKETVVTLPEGVTINPSQAEGLGVCSEPDLAGETLASEPGKGCPQSSKIGTIEVESPLAQGEIVKGALYVAKPFENLAEDALIAFYMVIRNRDLGTIIKLPFKVEPDPQTGQLITTTTTDLPQIPVSHFRVHFREGGRSPLITPPSCDSDPSTPGDDPYVTKAEFVPWSDPATTYTTTSSFQVESGVGGGPCPPGGTPPFKPGMEAGSIGNDAGAYSPFYLRLTRRDGDQDLTKLSNFLPPGMVAKLAGVDKCSDGAIAAAKAKTGIGEQASPSCPANSQIGNIIAGAGVGAQLLYVPGKIYLSGPYNGAPISVVAIVPAVAGPFDVGTVVTRLALDIDPKTAEPILDGSRSDPIPHILAGIPLRVRDIRGFVDRPNFTINPTNCNPFQVGAELWGGGADAFSGADDSPVSLSVPFQAANCAKLGFKPRLNLSLKGGTRRGDNPALKAVFRPRKGDANLRDLTLTFPRSEFVDNANFRTICTRVQFAADNCPNGAIYGSVKAFTPLLDEPLTGPVYLRSSNNLLPDAIFALRGIVDAEVAVRIDSLKGRLRATVKSAPDVPVSKVIVQMQGGKKGLFVNSTNLCGANRRAKVNAAGQNNRRHSASPVLKAAGCGGAGSSRGATR